MPDPVSANSTDALAAETPPVLFERMPPPPAGIAAVRRPAGLLASWRAVALRASLVGVAAGAVAIGLLENIDRFGNPAQLAAEQRADAPPLGLAPPSLAPSHADEQDSRGDRLDLSSVATPASTVAVR